jgi:hypothetical protein
MKAAGSDARQLYMATLGAEHSEERGGRGGGGFSPLLVAMVLNSDTSLCSFV